MNRYQIVEVTEQFNHAGTKATADIAVIAEQLGFQRINICMNNTEAGNIAKVKRQIGYYCDWSRCFTSIEPKSIVLLQHPFHHKQLTRKKILTKLKKEKNAKFISLVHDVEELRAFRYNDYYKNEFETMMDLADVLIVHNQKMKNWFIDQGVDEGKLVDLQIFDYLQNELNNKTAVFERSITIAGNLDTTKCGYIGKLGNLNGVGINLYGPNFDEKLSGYSNINYHGSFPVDEIPNKLTKGFGLVWDGNSLNGCQGKSGQYLKYNNPHKLSLYLSSGLPVVIWCGAAEADFVRKYNVGLCVNTLMELQEIFRDLTEDEYGKMSDNVAELKTKLINGEFGRRSIEEACKRVEF